MREIFRNSDSAWVGLYQSILEDAGIPTFVYNLGTLQMPAAGLAVAFFPLPIFFPTLCVLSDDDYADAMNLLQSFRDAPSPVDVDWKCPRCGQPVPESFTACWNCQAERSAG